MSWTVFISIFISLFCLYCLYLCSLPVYILVNKAVYNTTSYRPDSSETICSPSPFRDHFSSHAHHLMTRTDGKRRRASDDSLLFAASPTRPTLASRQLHSVSEVHTAAWWVVEQPAFLARPTNDRIVYVISAHQHTPVQLVNALKLY